MSIDLTLYKRERCNFNAFLKNMIVCVLWNLNVIKLNMKMKENDDFSTFDALLFNKR